MYSEDEYILEQFRKNFIVARNELIVIYGIGVHTEALLKNMGLEENKRVIGLMDASKTGLIIYDKKVLSYEEVAMIDNVMIVIIARKSVENIIYRRIEQFVLEHNISVYAINGEEIKLVAGDTAPKDCFGLQQKDLLKKIDRADVVSFDVFDTLLCRRVLRPVDVFRIIDVNEGKNLNFQFSKERMRAEAELTIENYNIYDIYAKLQENTSISEEERDRLMRVEVETEKVCLRRREDICQIFDYAIETKKLVLLISDMYLTTDILADFLVNKGIKKYEKLIVSTDYKTSKSEKLFEVVKAEFQIDANTWLHIGDNVYSDINAAQKNGIDTYRVYGTIEMLEQSLYGHLLDYNKSIEENIVLATFASIAYGNMFSGFLENGKLVVSDERKLAQLLVAPMLLKYVVWLLKHEGGSDLIIFPSRDGFILKQIYELIESDRKPESIYLYTSRRATLIAAAINERDIRHIIKLPSPDDNINRIRKRFELEDVILDEVDPQGLAQELLERLLKVSENERKQYLDYLESEGVMQAKKILLVDFVAVGTMQEALQRMTGKMFMGAYFCRRIPDSKFTKDLACISMYEMTGDFETAANIYKYYYFLENVVSSYEPTFKKIDANGNKCFYDEQRSVRAIEQLENMHEAIIQYSEEFLNILRKYDDMDADVKLYDEIIGLFGRNQMEISRTVLEEVINYDEFLGKRVTELNR